MLLPCQFTLLNGNQSGPDGVFFDGQRPASYTDPDIDPDNSLATADTAYVGNNLGPVNPNAGTGTYADSYVYNLLVAARVDHIPGATYSCTRTFQQRIWAMQWDGSFWNVRQFSVGETGFPDPEGDGTGTDGMGPLDTSIGGTTNVSPKGVLYYDDSPGLPCQDADNEINIGDCVYREDVFTYALTITLGSVSTTQTFNIGEVLKLTKVNNNGDASDFNDPTKNFISVSSVNIPNCYMTTTKAANVIGTTRPYIRLNTNVNDN